MPRPGRPDAAHLARRLAGHAVVPGVPPQCAAARAPAHAGAVDGARQAALGRRGAPTQSPVPPARCQRADQLLDLSPMNAPRHPPIPILPADEPGRRRFLKLMAASAALAGAGCSGPPAEPIVPYVRMPEQVVPGQPLFYATAFVRRGFAHGVLVESNMGRPTKVEGNPEH